LAATLGADGMKLYVDGNLVASNVNVYHGTEFNRVLESWGFFHSTPLGSYDDFIVYNRVLESRGNQKIVPIDVEGSRAKCGKSILERGYIPKEFLSA
jgi:hypothetical protein